MSAKSKAVMGVVDALGNKIGALGDYLKEFDPRTFYHYSPEPDITKFDPKTINDPFGEFGGGADYVPPGRGATYFTSDPKYSNKVMEDIHEIGEGKDFSDYDWEEIIGNEQAPTIYPVKIKTKDIFDFENPEHLKRLSEEGDYDFLRKMEILNEIPSEIEKGDFRTFENEYIQKKLKEAGFRGYRTNEPGTVGLFYSDKGDVRSIFAKFDPSKSKKGEILAAVPAGTLGALGAMDGESSN